MPGVINPLQLQSNQMHGQWNSGYGYDEMDFSAQFVNFEDPMASPMFSRQVLTAPFLDSKNDYEEMNQYLNTQLEIA
ncbi:hypothetical protein COL922a_014482 [Colletotrichum nupharicola]|nr:hypothetical protein COL922a_014482 [Colletotrichum nupharicola]